MPRPTALIALLCAGLALLLCGCGGSGSSGSGSGSNSGAPSITAQPANQSVSVGQSASFSVTATGSAPLNYQWQKNGSNIAGATSASYTTPPATPADNGSRFQVIVTNSAGTVTSGTATLTVAATAAVDVSTFKYDVARTGRMLSETTLTPSSVTSNGFGKVGFFPVDGKVDAQPLYLSN